MGQDLSEIVASLEARLRRLEERVATGEYCPSMLALESDEDGPTLCMRQVMAITGLKSDVLREMIDHKELRGVRHGRNYKVLWRSLRVYLYKSGALPLRRSERLASPIRPATLPPGPQ